MQDSLLGGAVMFFVSLAIVLVVGDFASTFFYHVPQHLWVKLHLRTHHDNRRSYWDHAVLSKHPGVLTRRVSSARCLIWSSLRR